MNRQFELIDADWDSVLVGAAQAQGPSLRIICPFIKHGPMRRLLERGSFQSIRVITRFNPNDFMARVSDTDALRLLLKHGAIVRGVENLHAKVYLFGDNRAAVTSANLTDAALLRNHEFGFIAKEPLVVKRCSDYFESLWKRTEIDLVPERIDEWDRKIAVARAELRSFKLPKLFADEGEDIGLPAAPTVAVPTAMAEAPQAFVKFFGQGNERAPRSRPMLEEIDNSGSHWACTYPMGRRPRQVQEGAVMFLARMVERPDDIIIYGRAIGSAYVVGRDDATPADIQRRDWKAKWGHYIRVDEPEFVAGTLANGILMSELMYELGADAFASTQRNARAGQGNLNPRDAYRQKPQVELSPEGTAWMHERLQRAFDVFGKLGRQDLAGLDWPQKPI